MEKETQEDEHHGDEAQGIGYLCQHQVFEVAVLVILEGGIRNHVVGKRVGVFYHDAVFGDVVVPVGRLVIIEQHDRRDGDVYPRVLQLFPVSFLHGGYDSGAKLPICQEVNNTAGGKFGFFMIFLFCEYPCISFDIILDASQRGFRILLVWK